MSGRTVPRFALAGVLVAAFAAPAAAQESLPEAPMPRAKANIEIELSFDDIRVKVLETRTGSFPIGPAVVPMPRERGDSTRIQLVAADELMCPPCPLPPITPNPLLGTWYRDTGVGVVAATFTHDELKLCLSQREGANTVTFTITAHYTLTKDGLVYGAVTGADVDAKLDGKAEAGMELAELSLVLQELADRPFSFRAKATSAGLMVSQLKFAADGSSAKDYLVLGGLYKSAKAGVVPAPAPLKTTVGTGFTAPALVDMPLPPPPPALPTMSEPIQRVGIDFNINPPQVLPPCQVVQPVRPIVYGLPAPTEKVQAECGLMKAVTAPTAPPGWAPAPHANVPAGAFGSLADTFGRMLLDTDKGQTGGITLPVCPQQPGGIPSVQPIGGYGSVTITAQPVTTIAPVKPGHVGTWVRMIGSKQCVVKVEADHLTITVSEAHEFDGQTVTGHLTFTADYHTTRDGLTAVGLLTSVDVKFDGDLPEDDTQAMLEKVGGLQKAMEEKPFAITFRRYGEALVIGNVRMPDAGDRMEAQPGTYIGGRYASVGDKPLPKLKVAKAPEPKPLPVPQYIPSATLPPSPYAGQGSELLPPQAIPHPATRPVDWAAPVPRQRVIQEMLPPAVAPTPTPPTMAMPEPVPPAVQAPYSISLGSGLRVVVPPLSQTPKTDRDTTRQLFNFYVGLQNQQYASDPNIQMQQFLYSREDYKFGMVGNEWRRFWFNDLPSHLTPERVHGGIY